MMKTNIVVIYEPLKAAEFIDKMNESNHPNGVITKTDVLADLHEHSKWGVIWVFQCSNSDMKWKKEVAEDLDETAEEDEDEE